MHFLLRKPAARKVQSAPSAIKNIAGAATQVAATLDAMLAYADQVRADGGITDVVNIGIGGSDLGPQMAVLALQGFAVQGKRFHFVSNVDGHELAAVLDQVKPRSTLFLIASKTFTTIETMTNARSARDWFTQQGGTDVARHFAALTTNVAAAKEFGITTTFGFWDWVGGRYSHVVGHRPAASPSPSAPQGFRELLAGAHAMDEHFATAPLESNLPVRLGAAGCLVPQLPRLHQPQHRAVPQRPAAAAGLPAAAGDGKQRQARGP